MMTTIYRVVLLLGLFALVGCSGGGGPAETATVTGKVTHKGKPLPGGRITFYSAKDASKAGGGPIKADGTYEAKLVPQGECKVTVENGYLKTAPPPPATGDMPGSEAAGQKYVPISAGAAKHETSGITTTVGGKTHTFDFEVK